MLDVSLVILAVELDHDVSEILIAISVIIILCQIVMVMDQMMQVFHILVIVIYIDVLNAILQLTAQKQLKVSL